MKQSKRSVSLFWLALLPAMAACASAPVKQEARTAEVDVIDIRAQSFFDFTAAARLRMAEGVKPVRATWEILSGDPLEALGAGELALDEGATQGGVLEVSGKVPYGDMERLGELMERAAPLSIVMRGTVEGSDGSLWEYSRGGLVRVPRSPQIKVYHVEAASIPTEKRIALVFYVRVENHNPFEIQLERMTYDLFVNDQRLIEQGIAGSKRRVPNASSAEMEIHVSLDEVTFPEVERYLRPGRDLRYLIEGMVELGVGRIPIELSGPIQVGSGS